MPITIAVGTQWETKVRAVWWTCFQTPPTWLPVSTAGTTPGTPSPLARPPSSSTSSLRDHSPANRVPDGQRHGDQPAVLPVRDRGADRRRRGCFARRLFVSQAAHLITPAHRLLDQAQEVSRGAGASAPPGAHRPGLT